MPSPDLFSIVIAINHLSDSVKETQEIVKQVNNIDWSKDYIMPFLTLLLSAAVAYLSAKSGYRWQDKLLTNKLKIDTVNKTILGFQNMQGILLSLKGNYANNLSEHPLQRTIAVPQMIYSFSPLNLNYEHLLQVIMTNDISIKNQPWLSISSYVSVQDQFNQLDKVIQERNSYDYKIKDSLAREYERKSFSVDEILSNVNPVDLHKYIELTEIIINMIDNLTISANDFLRNFPETASQLIGKDKSKYYKMVQGYKNESELVKNLQKRTVPLDFELAEEILNIPSADIKRVLCDQSYTIQTPK
ncbi:hypothetical protein ABFV38_09720 [Enterobacter cloacae complex sp. Mu1197]|uniref:Uncharacterized protein n=2 Tax=Enterobacter TaxID=547 RepID=A0AAU7G2J6_9ENTR